MPTNDRLTAALEEMRKRYEVWGEADVPRLLAALDVAQTLISGWEEEAVKLDKMADATENPMRSAHLSVRAQGCQDHARALREVISAELLGEDARSDG